MSKHSGRHGGGVDHATMNRWGITESPHLAAALPRRQRAVWVRWRRDATDGKGKGPWRSVSRAVDTPGQTLAVLRPAPRDTEVARRLLKQARRRHGLPATLPLAGRDATEAAMKSDNEAPGTPRSRRQVHYLHHSVAQAHRAVKRGTRPRLGGKACDAAQDPLVGSARRHMLQNSQMRVEAGEERRTAAALCYSVAASCPLRQGQLPLHGCDPHLLHFFAVQGFLVFLSNSALDFCPFSRDNKTG